MELQEPLGSQEVVLDGAEFETVTTTEEKADLVWTYVLSLSAAVRDQVLNSFPDSHANVMEGSRGISDLVALALYDDLFAKKI